MWPTCYLNHVFIIHFFRNADNEDPVLIGLSMNVTQNTDNGLATAVVTWTQPTASDNSASVTLTSNHESGEVFEIGITMVSYTATDPATNMVTESFAITVEGIPTFFDIMKNDYLWL